MAIKIKKRNGDIVDFDKLKIINAINNAFLEVDGVLYETDTAQDIADEIEAVAKILFDHPDNKILTVEQIQDLVEDYLMRSERRDVARSYIRYLRKKWQELHNLHSLMLLEKNLMLQMFKIKMPMLMNIHLVEEWVKQQVL